MHPAMYSKKPLHRGYRMIAEVKPLQKFNKLEVLPLMRTIGNN